MSREAGLGVWAKGAMTAGKAVFHTVTGGNEGAMILLGCGDRVAEADCDV